MISFRHYIKNQSYQQYYLLLCNSKINFNNNNQQHHRYYTTTSDFHEALKIFNNRNISGSATPSTSTATATTTATNEFDRKIGSGIKILTQRKDQREYPEHPYIVRTTNADKDFSQENPIRSYPDLKDSALFRKRHILIEVNHMRRDATSDEVAFIYLYELTRHFNLGLTFNTEYFSKLKNIRKLKITTVDKLVDGLIRIKCFHVRVFEQFLRYYIEIDRLDKALKLWRNVKPYFKVDQYQVFLRVLASALQSKGDTAALDTLLLEANIEGVNSQTINLYLASNQSSNNNNTTLSTNNQLNQQNQQQQQQLQQKEIDNGHILANKQELFYYNILLSSSIGRRDYNTSYDILQTIKNSTKLQPNDCTYRHLIQVLLNNDDTIDNNNNNNNESKTKLIEYISTLADHPEIPLVVLTRKEMMALMEYAFKLNNASILERAIHTYESKFQDKALLKYYNTYLDSLLKDELKFTKVLNKLISERYYNIDILNKCLKHIALVNDLKAFEQIYESLPNLYLSPDSTSNLIAIKYFVLEGHLDSLTQYIKSIDVSATKYLPAIITASQKIKANYINNNNNANDIMDQKLDFYKNSFYLHVNEASLKKWFDFIGQLNQDSPLSDIEKEEALKIYLKNIGKSLFQ